MANGIIRGLCLAGLAFASCAGADDRVDADIAALDRWSASVIEDHDIPAVVAFVADDDRMIWTTARGEYEPGVPILAEAILPLASVGKIYTATAAMILVDRGLIELDAPVADYLPGFGDENGDVTVRHLLTHTSGLGVSGDGFWDIWDTHFGATTTRDFALALSGLPRNGPAGERFEYGYTGANYEVLAAVVESASGETLEAFLTREVFEPLGLDSTYFYITESEAGRLPAIYALEDGIPVSRRARGEEWPRSAYFAGGGGISSSMADIHRFARLFTSDGSVDGHRILSQASIDAMTSDQLGTVAWSPGLSWGFGGAVPDGTAPGSRAVYGWIGGGFAQLWIDRANGRTYFTAMPLDPPGEPDLLESFRQAAGLTVPGID